MAKAQAAAAPPEQEAAQQAATPMAVTIDGTEYPLRFTMGAVRRLGKEYGFELKVKHLQFDGMGAETIMLLASVALINGGAKLTLDEAEELLAEHPDANTAASQHALARISERLSPGLVGAGKADGGVSLTAAHTAPAMATDAPLFDFDAIDVSLARHYGMRPAEVDDLTPRDCQVMTRAASERERDLLQPTMLLLDGLLNYGGLRGEDFKPVRFGYHADALLSGGADSAERREAVQRRVRALKEEHRAAKKAKLERLRVDALHVVPDVGDDVLGDAPHVVGEVGGEVEQRRGDDAGDAGRDGGAPVHHALEGEVRADRGGDDEEEGEEPDEIGHGGTG